MYELAHKQLFFVKSVFAAQRNREKRSFWHVLALRSYFECLARAVPEGCGALLNSYYLLKESHEEFDLRLYCITSHLDYPRR